MGRKTGKGLCRPSRKGQPRSTCSTQFRPGTRRGLWWHLGNGIPHSQGRWPQECQVEGPQAEFLGVAMCTSPSEGSFGNRGWWEAPPFLLPSWGEKWEEPRTLSGDGKRLPDIKSSVNVCQMNSEGYMSYNLLIGQIRNEAQGEVGQLPAMATQEACKSQRQTGSARGRGLPTFFGESASCPLTCVHPPPRPQCSTSGPQFQSQGWGPYSLPYHGH